MKTRKKEGQNEELPPIDIAGLLEERKAGIVLPKWIHWVIKARMLMMPRKWKRRLKEVAWTYDISLEDALLVNLDYELGGGACTTAAIPGAKGYYMARALDWDIPEQVRKRIKWQWDDCGKFRHRAMDAYIGVVTGHSVFGDYAIALNAPPYPYHKINYRGTPITWIIREALETCDSYEDAVSFIGQSRPIIGGFVTVIGKKDAVWLDRQSDICIEYSYGEYKDKDMLTVGNDYTADYVSKEKALKKWRKSWKGNRPSGKPGYPVINEDTADFVCFKV